MKCIIFLISVFLCLQVSAVTTSDQKNITLPEHCKQSSMHTVTAKVRKNSKLTFRFAYQKSIKHKDTALPTFIIIPGGPGKSSLHEDSSHMFEDLYELMWSLPLDSNVIYTGSRGVGCNQNLLFKNTDYSTDNIVADLLNLIKKEKLNNYIIVAHSFGTIIGTKLVYQIEKNVNLIPPKAFVSSGTVGKFFEKNKRFYGYEESWKKLYKDLPVSVQKKIPTSILNSSIFSDFPFPFSFNQQTWLNFIMDSLMTGPNYLAYEYDTPILEESLLLLKPGGRAAHLKVLEDRVMLYTPEFFDLKASNQINNDSFFYEIYCREMSDEQQGSVESDICYQKNIPFSNPFDSKKYLIKTPIVYLQGDRDPAVPFDKAWHHYQVQKEKGNKIFIKLPKGGHNAIAAFQQCREELWSVIVKRNWKGLQEVLDEICYNNAIIVK